MSKINLGIVGLGILSQTVHIPCFYKNKKIQIKALCDHNKHLLSLVSSKYGISNTYTSVKQMIKREKLDAIALIVQRPNTFSVSKKILISKTNLFVEKPISIKVNQAKELVRIQKKNKIKFVVAYMKRSDDAVKYLKKKLKIKKFSNPMSVQYQSYIGVPKPIKKNFFQHKNRSRRKKFSLNKNFKSKSKIYEKYLNVHCHSINLIRYLFGPLHLNKVFLSRLAEGSVFFKNKDKINIELKNKFLKDSNWKEFIILRYPRGYIKLIIQNPFNKKSYSKIVFSENKKDNLKVKEFKTWSFMNQSNNFVNYLKNHKLKSLSNCIEGLQDIQMVNNIFKKI